MWRRQCGGANWCGGASVAWYRCAGPRFGSCTRAEQNLLTLGGSKHGVARPREPLDLMDSLDERGGRQGRPEEHHGVTQCRNQTSKFDVLSFLPGDFASYNFGVLLDLDDR